MEHKRDGTVKRGYASLEHVHLYDLDLEKREIFLFGHESYIDSVGTEEMWGEPGIEFTISNRFIRNIRILQSATTDPILVHMKSNGGIWEEGMAIYDAIKACPNHVTILNYTHARSMTSIILQAADHRAMMPHSSFMFHEGEDGFEGTTKQMRSYVEFSVKQDCMKDVYADRMLEKGEHSNKSRTQIKSWLQRQMDLKEDVYMNPREAVNAGLADEVFGDNDKYDWESLRTV